jgi:lactate dehydrogenase-like 2-hydroxyacid dehydrogenase
VQPAIVILDEVELSDEQYRRLESLGTVATFDGNPADDEETVARAQDADVLVLGWTTLRAGVLARLGRLKMISIWATGYDYVDVRAARERGVVTANVPAYAGHAVAELNDSLVDLTGATHCSSGSSRPWGRVHMEEFRRF